MQTVNFRCGHCNNLMAVSHDYLGQQVRCPTCQNVVLAPSSAPSPATAPAPTPPAPEPENLFPRIAENEDIFSSSTQATDSLFDEPARPLVELPASPFVTPDHTLASEPMPLPAVFLEPSPAPHEEPTHTGTYSPGTEMFQSSPASALTESVSSPWMSSPSENGQTASSEPSFAEPKKPREPRQTKINWFIPLVFMPLLLYAVLATVAIAILYLKMASAKPTMFDQMPDTQGDTPGTRDQDEGDHERPPRIRRARCWTAILHGVSPHVLGQRLAVAKPQALSPITGCKLSSMGDLGRHLFPTR